MKRYQRYLLNMMKGITLISIILFTYLIFYSWQEISRMNHELNAGEERLKQEVETYLNNHRGKYFPSECFPEKVLRVHYPNLHCKEKESCHFPASCHIHHDNVTDPDKVNIYVYGGSSVIKNIPTFTYFLQEYMKEKVEVTNFGISGIDSHTIKKRVESTIDDYGSPDLVIIYSGHNDYANFFHRMVNSFFRDFFTWSSRLLPFRTHNPDPGRDMRGPLFNLLQDSGLVSFDARRFDIIKEKLLDVYVENNEEIQHFLSERDVPVLYLTTIGNLQVEPYGDIDTTRQYFRKGVEEEDYNKSIDLLRKAMDSEIFTYDVRAPKMLNDYIRSLDGENLYTLDIEQKMKKNGSEFGGNEFTDYLHITQDVHEYIAELLHEFIINNNVIG